MSIADFIRKTPTIEPEEPAGMPHLTAADSMPIRDLARVIARISPAFRIGPILSTSEALRKGEVLGLRLRSVWLPTLDERSAREWFVGELDRQGVPPYMSAKYEDAFRGDPFADGLIYVTEQRTYVYDEHTGDIIEALKPAPKSRAGIRLMAIPAILRPYLRWYIDVFFSGYDLRAEETKTELLVRSMKVDAEGHHLVPRVHEIAGAVKHAMGEEEYSIGKRGYSCGLHLMRKSIGGWLDHTNVVSGRAISDHLGHSERRDERDPKDRPNKVTARIYLPSVRREQMLDVAEISNFILTRGFESFERYQELPLRCGNAYMVGEEVADRLSITINRADNMAREGRLPAFKRWIAGYPSRRWAFERAAVEAYAAERSPEALAPAGTMSSAEVAAKLDVSVGLVNLLVRQDRLKALTTPAGFRILESSFVKYRETYRPVGTLSAGQALTRINLVVPMTYKQLHRLCIDGVIRAHRRPKGRHGFWLRPYTESVEAYVRQIVECRSFK